MNNWNKLRKLEWVSVSFPIGFPDIFIFVNASSKSSLTSTGIRIVEWNFLKYECSSIKKHMYK